MAAECKRRLPCLSHLSLYLVVEGETTSRLAEKQNSFRYLNKTLTSLKEQQLRERAKFGLLEVDVLFLFFAADVVVVSVVGVVNVAVEVEPPLWLSLSVSLALCFDLLYSPFAFQVSYVRDEERRILYLACIAAATLWLILPVVMVLMLATAPTTN